MQSNGPLGRLSIKRISYLGFYSQLLGKFTILNYGFHSVHFVIYKCSLKGQVLHCPTWKLHVEISVTCFCATNIQKSPTTVLNLTNFHYPSLGFFCINAQRHFQWDGFNILRRISPLHSSNLFVAADDRIRHLPLVRRKRWAARATFANTMILAITQ